MPGESALSTVVKLATASALTFAVERQQRTVWVTLSGILDPSGLDRLVRRLAPCLEDRGYRVVLDGRRLLDAEPDSVAMLARWQRTLEDHHHRLQLLGWEATLRGRRRQTSPSPSVRATGRELRTDCESATLMDAVSAAAQAAADARDSNTGAQQTRLP
jgi:hypothetical protein